MDQATNKGNQTNKQKMKHQKGKEKLLLKGNLIFRLKTYQKNP